MTALVFIPPIAVKLVARPASQPDPVRTRRRHPGADKPPEHPIGVKRGMLRQAVSASNPSLARRQRLPHLPHPPAQHRIGSIISVAACAMMARMGVALCRCS